MSRKQEVLEEKCTGEQVTFSLMGQEGTKGDFEACVSVCVCVGVYALQRMFLIWVCTCASGVFSAFSEERLFYSAAH